MYNKFSKFTAIFMIFSVVASIIGMLMTNYMPSKIVMIAWGLVIVVLETNQLILEKYINKLERENKQ